ncbi:MAG TPA: hypothetical protein VHZ98_10365 [Galbitalea sp.]|jgi:hypothetical protein|nr:hypothetical protein [Galbitalea sp.]
MREPQSPKASTVWSAIWIVLVGTIVLWLLATTIATYWVWLLLAAILTGAVTVLIVWYRRRNRW